MTKTEMILAAVVHPQFKLRWLTDDAGKFKGKAILVEAMRKAEVELAAAAAVQHKHQQEPCSQVLTMLIR
jgi:hypothetical protein